MKFIYVILVGLWLLSSVASAAEKPKIAADSAILIEASGERVIFEKDADVRRYPASMTKIMTALLVLENDVMDKVTTISPTAAFTEDSSLGLQPNDNLTIADLTRGLMLVSDNGAAVAIAESIDGSVDAFARRMNQKASAIGCSNTHFNNPNGLPDPAHYSTARDMAKICAYAMRREDFRELVGSRYGVSHWLIPAGRWVEMENTNKLLATYYGADGIKTGWTRAAGGCLAASASRDGMRLIAVVMHSTDSDTRFDDAKKLLDYGFATVKMKHALSKERIRKNIWVENGKNFRVAVGAASDVIYPVFEGEKAKDFKISYELPQFLSAPINVGDKIGQIAIKYHDKTVGTVDIIAKESVGEGFSFLSYFLVGLLTKLSALFA